MIKPRPRNVWVCIASGPSVTQDDIDHCIGRAHIAATNSTFFKCGRHLEILHAADGEWWSRHYEDVIKVTNPNTCRYFTTATKAAKTYNLEQVRVIPYQESPHRRRTREPIHGTSLGWSTRPGEVYSGGLTGYQLLQIVGWQMPSKILLLGYDMTTGQHGEIHHHEDHAAPFSNMNKMYQQIGFFTSLARAADVPIINCSSRTAITAFPRRELRKVLP